MKFRKQKQQQSIPLRRRTSDVRRQVPEPIPNAFQRNRTLTGSTSRRIQSASQDTAHLKSTRTETHELHLTRRKVFGILTVVTILVIISGALLYQFTARVSVAVSDASISKQIDTDRYEQAIETYYGVHPFERLRFVLNRDKLIEYLRASLPEVMDVESATFGSFIGETRMTLAMRQPVAGWTINQNQYYVDTHGIAFQINYYADPIVTIIDQTGIDLTEGSLVASNRFLSFVGRVVALSGVQGYNVTAAILPPGTTRQLEVRLEGIGPVSRLSIDRPVGEQVEDMVRAVDYMTSTGKKPNYIDVRVSGKAFYK